MKKISALFLSLALAGSLKAQDFFGIQTSNHAGVVGVYSNPANIVDNRLKFDMTLFGIHATADNNYVGVKRSAIKASDKTKFGFISVPTFSGSTWDTVRRESPSYWKNNFTTVENANDKGIYSSVRIMLPSFMLQLNGKNAIAFNWSIRNYVNIDGISPKLAKLAYEEFMYPNLWVTNLNNKNLSIQQMLWAEYGLSYARVLKDDGEHFLKAGVTAKLLQGLNAAYMHIDNLDYNFFTDDTVSIFKSDVAYGHSANLDPVISAFGNSDDVMATIRQNYKFESYPGFGFDIGAVYEWRPDYKDYKYEMDGEKDLWRRDRDKYKLKASFAVNDIGGIRYRKGALSNDFTADVNYWDLNSVDVNSVNGFDSLMTNMFGSKESETTFKMALPTSINFGVDYHIWKPFFVALNGNIGNLMKNREARVHDFTTISLQPRFDHKWFGFTLPITYNSFSAVRGKPINLGAMLRLGPLFLGANNIPGMLTQDVYGANFYMMMKVPIPYGHKKDKDKDKISDKKDKCKEIPGVWEFMGCPDTDGDHIPDAEDKCPTVAGIKELQGCPDKDGDGITDLDDSCPEIKGPKEFNGCPDRDGDGIIDKEDECPDAAGLKEFMGCPDKDGDGTPDAFDNCPDVFGPKEYKGCPDKDGDGLLDKDDACPDVAGPKENKGCPWPDTDKDGVLDKDDACPSVPGLVDLKGCPPPPPMKEKEKKILERAFSSLEFATAKDVIKSVSFPSLNDLAKLMIEHKADWTLTLSGHTDNQGDPAKNMLLSEKRSIAVKKYLVKKGVPESIIFTEWYGDTKPVADNAKPEGRQKNRRVEMKVTFKEQ